MLDPAHTMLAALDALAADGVALDTLDDRAAGETETRVRALFVEVHQFVELFSRRPGLVWPAFPPGRTTSVRA